MALLWQHAEIMFLIKRLNPLAAVVDQAWLSLLNFSISMAFIWYATKAEYGYYILLLAPLLLVQSLQNAIVNSPLATFLPSAEDTEKNRTKATAVSLHIYLGLVCGVLGFMGLWGYGLVTRAHIDILLLSGFTLAIAGTIAREAQRSFAYVQGQGLRALAGDLLYGLVLLIGIAMALADSSLSAGIVLLMTGVAGLAPLIIKISKFNGLQTHAEPLRKFWSCSRWALPSVMVTWVNLSSYPFFAGKALGLSAVADIGAARLFLMPIGLMMAAWANWYRPKISGWLAEGNMQAITSVTNRSLQIGLAGMTMLAAFFIFAYPWIETFLGGQYQGLQALILMWLFFFSISLVINIYMATLMTDEAGYKALHHITWLALALSLPGFVLFSHNGALWVIGVLCVVELLQAVLVINKARKYLKRLGAQA